MFSFGFAITAMLEQERLMNNIIWLVGVVVIILVVSDTWASGNLWYF